MVRGSKWGLAFLEILFYPEGDAPQVGGESNRGDTNDRYSEEIQDPGEATQSYSEAT
jgi:hypothetical protein